MTATLFARPARTARPATARQRAFLASLLADRTGRDGEAVLAQLEADTARKSGHTDWTLDTGTASILIDAIKATPRPAKAKATGSNAEDGLYRTADGTVYRVVTGRRGFPYAMQLHVDEDARDAAAAAVAAWKAARAAGEELPSLDDARIGYWETAPGMVRRLTADQRMTAEEAAEYGALYGSCLRCARTLTDPVSIDRGIGPVCAGKI